MRRILLEVGVASSLLAGTVLSAQHTGPANAAHVSAGAQAPPATHQAPHAAAPPASHPSQIGRTGHWPSWNATSNHREPAREHHPYVYPGLLSFGYGLPVGYGDEASYDQGDLGQAPQTSPNGDYGPPSPDPQVAQNAAPVYREPYQGSASQNLVEAPVHPQPATILIFKDGRPAKQVHNYALTGTRLWDLDGDNRQEISLDLIDLPATVKANHDAGVDFALPGSR